ncbi:MAG: hypothetical protein ACLVJ6_02190 [Merdibacter sp.]
MRSIQRVQRLSALGVGTTIQDLEDFSSPTTCCRWDRSCICCSAPAAMDGAENYYGEVNSGKGLKLPSITRFYISYILPLIVIYLIPGLWQVRPSMVPGDSLLFPAVCRLYPPADISRSENGEMYRNDDR